MNYNYSVEPRQMIKTSAPEHPLELGRWHEKHGRLNEALSCFERAVLETSQEDPSSADHAQSAQCRIEYGRISAKLNRFLEAEDAFIQALRYGENYAISALIEWGALLHNRGWKDAEIYSRLTEEISQTGLSSACLGHALYHIGAYTEAELCFNNMEYDRLCTGMLHVRCLVSNNRISGALGLIGMLKDIFHSELNSSPNEYSLICLVHFLCQWRHEGRMPFLPATLEDRLKLAETAVTMGMTEEAERILDTEGSTGEYALIHMLHTRGYIEQAGERLSRLQDNPVDLYDPYGPRVQFIAAERLYDQSKYETAADLFKELRLLEPGWTEPRFGEAACYLHSALLSLSARMERVNCPESIKHDAAEYLSSIHAAIHIVESTKWHTSWTTGQLRRSGGARRKPQLN